MTVPECMGWYMGWIERSHLLFCIKYISICLWDSSSTLQRPKDESFPLVKSTIKADIFGVAILLINSNLTLKACKMLPGWQPEVLFR
jgi:hypothetical protein